MLFRSGVLVLLLTTLLVGATTNILPLAFPPQAFKNGVAHGNMTDILCREITVGSIHTSASHAKAKAAFSMGDVSMVCVAKYAVQMTPWPHSSLGEGTVDFDIATNSVKTGFDLLAATGKSGLPSAVRMSDCQASFNMNSMSFNGTGIASAFSNFFHEAIEDGIKKNGGKQFCTMGPNVLKQNINPILAHASDSITLPDQSATSFDFKMTKGSCDAFVWGDFSMNFDRRKGNATTTSVNALGGACHADYSYSVLNQRGSGTVRATVGNGVLNFDLQIDEDDPKNVVVHAGACETHIEVSDLKFSGITVVSKVLEVVSPIVKKTVQAAYNKAACNFIKKLVPVTV